VASSHAALSRRIATELEVPLKAYLASPDFVQLPQFEANLSSLADSHETTRLKSEKAKSKGKGKAKQEEKAREENDARALWETESPLILEKIQTIDEARMLMLKDIFVKCMMMEVEMSQSSTGEAEEIMNALLSLTPSKEVEAFVRQQKAAPKAIPTHERRRSIISNVQTYAPPPTASPAPSRPPPPQQQPSSSTLSVTADSSSIRAEKRKSRFGTILRSGRNSIKPNLGIRGFSPDKKKKEEPQVEKERSQTFANLHSQPAQNGVTEDHNYPASPSRASTLPVLKPPRSPAKEEQPNIQAPPTQPSEEAEKESILSSDSNYLPPLRVEIKKEVIPEEASEREAALNTLQTTLRAQSTISRRSRGRREGRSSFIDVGNNELGAISPPIPEMGQLRLSPSQEVGPMTMSPTQDTTLSSSPISPSVVPVSSYSTLTPIRADSDAYSLSSVRTSSRPTGIALHPDLEISGFNISILESLSAILSDNQVQRIFVTGEIALSLHGQRAGGVQINNPDKLEQIVVNNALLNDSANGIYTLTTESLPPKGAIALKYKAANFEDPQSKVPILMRTMWKIEPGAVSLMVGYCLNPAFTLSRALSNVVICVSIPRDPRILSCQSKPQGQFSKERGQLLWQIPTIGEAEQIMIAKFTTEGQVKGPGTVEARWECVGITVSGIDVSGIAAKDPFADEEDLFFQANVLRKLISGKYYCQS